MRLLTGRGRLAPPVAGGRRIVGRGISLFLIAVGAILLFAVPSGTWGGLNLNVVGLIVLILGVVRLLVLRGAPTSDGGLRGFINPSGVDDPSVHDDETAAALDAQRIHEDARYFSPEVAGPQQDEL
jgi:hypothetical protein